MPEFYDTLILAMGGGGEAFNQQTAQALLWMGLGALFMPLLSQYLRLPAAIGEILYGILIGPYFLDFVHTSTLLKFISFLGFFLLMFIAGLELDFNQIIRGGKSILIRGLAYFILVFALSFAAVMYFEWNLFLVWMLAAISIGLPLALLHENDLARSRFGQNLLIQGSIGEFLLIVGVTILSSYSHSGGLGLGLLKELLQLCAIFLLAYILLLVFRNLVWWFSSAFTRLLSHHDPSEIGIRAGFALLFVFVAITIMLGIDPLLGAFLSGALISFIFRSKSTLEHKFMSMGNGFFIPFFFIYVGVEFDVAQARKMELETFLKMLLLLVVIRFISNIIIYGRQQSWAEHAAGACLLAAPLTLLVVLSNIGVQLGFLEASKQPTIIALAVLSSSLYPLLFKQILMRTDLGGKPTES